MLAAAEIITSRSQGLWDVKTDDTYQESAEIQAMFQAPAPPRRAAVGQRPALATFGQKRG